jgi:hypothetical protein
MGLSRETNLVFADVRFGLKADIAAGLRDVSALPLKADVDSDIALGRKLVFVLSCRLSEPKALFGDLVSRFRRSYHLAVPSLRTSESEL